MLLTTLPLQAKMKIMQRSPLIILVGPTCAGKSELALSLALQYRMEIVSADSLQVYRYLDTGTAKPSLEDRKKVKHHLIDVADPDEEFSAVRFMELARGVIDSLIREGTSVLVVGGTGLYIKALTKGIFRGPAADEELRSEIKKDVQKLGKEYLYQRLKEVDPASASRIHPNDTYRIMRALEVYELTQKPMSSYQSSHAFRESPYRSVKIGIERERKELYQRIEKRVEQMIENGLVEEVKNILKRGYDPQLKPLQSLGYKQVIQYLQGEYDLYEAIRLIKRDTKRYAKRQLTWFKGDPEVEWFTLPEYAEKIEERINSFLQNVP
jgi:tRNA dimethylallyltransferase